MRFKFAPLIVIGLFLLGSSAARAQPANCTAITTLPYVITTPGSYCLTQSLATSSTGNAIIVNADDVLIDLNGYLLDGSGAGPGTVGAGVIADQKSNITVRNGTIRGFATGVRLLRTNPWGLPSQGHVIEKLRLDRNFAEGIRAEGRGIMVRNNSVFKTGGSTQYLGMRGISVNGPSAVVSDNVVVEMAVPSGGNAFGIFVQWAPGSVIERNLVSNETTSANTIGIVVEVSDKSVIAENKVFGMNLGIKMVPGNHAYRGNTVGGAVLSYHGGTPAGTDNFGY